MKKQQLKLESLSGSKFEGFKGNEIQNAHLVTGGDTHRYNCSTPSAGGSDIADWTGLGVATRLDGIIYPTHTDKY